MGTELPVPPPPPPPPTRRFTDTADQATTWIGSTISVEGDLEGSDSLELAGSLRGTIAVDGLCHVRDTGRIVGGIVADHCVIEGHVEGNVKARGKVELRATAHVEGDIEAGSVAIADGCFFDGRIHMEGGVAGAATPFTEKRRRP